MRSVRVGRGPWRSLGSALLLTAVVAGGCEAQHLLAGSNGSPPAGGAGTGGSLGGGGAPGNGGNPGGGGNLGSGGDATQTRCPAASVTRFQVPTAQGWDPWFIAVDAGEQEAWFTFRQNWDTSRIGRIAVTGDVTGFDLPTEGTVTSLAAGSQADVWYTQIAGALGKIGHIDLLGIVTEFSVPTPDSAPDSIVLAPDGNLWFVETGVVNQIGRMSPQGAFTEFHIPTAVPGATTFAQHLAAGQDGRLFLLTQENGMYVVTADGDMSWIPMRQYGVPAGVAVGPDQGLYFIESTTSDLVRLDASQPDPESARLIDVPGGEPTGVWASPDSSLWLSTGNDLMRVNSWNITDYRACDTEYLSGLSVAPSGAVWFTDTRGGAITRLVP